MSSGVPTYTKKASTSKKSLLSTDVTGLLSGERRWKKSSFGEAEARANTWQRRKQLLQRVFHTECSGFVKYNRNQYKNLTCWKPLTVVKVLSSLRQGRKALQFHVLPFHWLFWIKLQNNDIPQKCSSRIYTTGN